MKTIDIIFMLKSQGFNLNFLNIGGLSQFCQLSGGYAWFREYGVPAFESTGYIVSRIPGHIVSHYPLTHDHSLSRTLSESDSPLGELFIESVTQSISDSSRGPIH